MTNFFIIVKIELLKLQKTYKQHCNHHFRYVLNVLFTPLTAPSGAAPLLPRLSLLPLTPFSPPEPTQSPPPPHTDCISTTENGLFAGGPAVDGEGGLSGHGQGDLLLVAGAHQQPAWVRVSVYGGLFV